MINPLITLIDKAVEVCGSQAELARRMGIFPADVHNMQANKRPISPETAAELADIAGDDARQAVIDAIIIRNATNRRGAHLKEILGKALAAGVVGMWLFSYSGDSTYAMEKIASRFTSIHIVLSTIRRFGAYMHQVVQAIGVGASYGRTTPMACH